MSFRKSLAHLAKASGHTKYLSLNDAPCMVRPTLFDLNPAELKYYPFIISSDKCSGTCNVLLPLICVPKETKEINVKIFNMITNKKRSSNVDKTYFIQIK